MGEIGDTIMSISLDSKQSFVKRLKIKMRKERNFAHADEFERHPSVIKLNIQTTSRDDSFLLSEQNIFQIKIFFCVKRRPKT